MTDAPSAAREQTAGSSSDSPASSPVSSPTCPSARLSCLARLGPFILGLVLALAFTAGLHSLRRHMPPGHVWRGWSYYDIPSYYANAREVFENGNGIFYANPYSLEPDSPHIYTNLQIMLKGWLWKAGVGFSAQEILWRAAGATAMFGLLALIVAACLPPGRWRVWTYLMAALGGGITVLPALVIAAEGVMFPPPGRPSFWRLLAEAHVNLEQNPDILGVWGWWFLNTLRNLVYSTECVYHALFFGVIVCALRRRWTGALALFAVTWWTHPFTGLELGAILWVWLSIELVLAWRRRESPGAHRTVWIALSLIQMLFLLYYGPYMGRSEEHRSVTAVWRGPEATVITTASLGHVLLSYGPLLLGLLWAFGREGRARLRDSSHARLLVAWAAVVFLLMHHDKIPGVRNPAQPLHFSRGYLYIVLVFWSGQGLAAWARRSPHKARRIALLAWLVFGVALADNVLFFGRYFLGGEARQRGLLFISEKQQAMLHRLNDFPPNQLVFTLEDRPGRGLGYLIPTETSHRSFLGHGTNAPHVRERTAAYLDWIHDPDFPLPERAGADLVVADLEFLATLPWLAATPARAETLGRMMGPQWKRADAPPGFALWTRAKADTE